MINKCLKGTSHRRHCKNPTYTFLELCFEAMAKHASYNIVRHLNRAFLPAVSIFMIHHHFLRYDPRRTLASFTVSFWLCFYSSRYPEFSYSFVCLQSISIWIFQTFFSRLRITSRWSLHSNLTHIFLVFVPDCKFFESEHAKDVKQAS